MNPETAPPPGSRVLQETDSSPSRLERILSNRWLLYGALAVLAVALVLWVANSAARKARLDAVDNAWEKFYAGLERLHLEAQANGTFTGPFDPFFYQTVDPEKQARAFRAIVEDVEGSAAEPLALLYLAHAHLVGRQIDQADRVLDDLVERFPDHYLVTADASYLPRSMVDELRAKIELERKFLEENPDFLSGKPRAGDEAADGTGGESDGGTASAKTEDGDGATPDAPEEDGQPEGSEEPASRESGSPDGSGS